MLPRIHIKIPGITFWSFEIYTILIFVLENTGLLNLKKGCLSRSEMLRFFDDCQEKINYNKKIGISPGWLLIKKKIKNFSRSKAHLLGTSLLIITETF